MRAKFGLGIAAAVAFTLGSNCGRPSTRVSFFGLEPKYVTVPAAMGPLIPADAVGLLYLDSIDEAERSLRELSSNAAEDSARIDLVKAITQRFAIPEESIDRTRPAALALSLFNLGRPIPMPTVILPVHDEAQALEALRGRPGRPEPLGNKGYVGVPLLPGYELGTGIPPLAKNLPAGSMAVRLRVDRILEVVQPFVDMALAKMEDASAQKGGEGEAHHKAMAARTASVMTRQALDLLRATETLECGVRTQAGNVAVAYRMQATAESPNVEATAKRAAGLVDLARCVSEEYPVMGLLAMDFEHFVGLHERISEVFMEESMAETPGPIRDYIRSLMQYGHGLYRLADGQLFNAMRFTEAGAEVIHVLSTRDPVKLMEQSREIMNADLMQSAGLGTVEWQAPEDIDGVRVEGVEIRWDLAKLMELHQSSNDIQPKETMSIEVVERVMRTFFGGDAMVIRFAAVGERVVFVTHPNRAAIERCIANLKKDGRLPAGLQVARGYSKEPLCYWVQADLREVLLPILEAVDVDTTGALNEEIVRQLEAMEPARITAHATAGHQAYQGACSLNLAPFQQLSNVLARGQKREHHEEGPGPSEP